jgi:hypothetical protein
MMNYYQALTSLGITPDVALTIEYPDGTPDTVLPAKLDYTLATLEADKIYAVDNVLETGTCARVGGCPHLLPLVIIRVRRLSTKPTLLTDNAKRVMSTLRA